MKNTEKSISYILKTEILRKNNFRNIELNLAKLHQALGYVFLKQFFIGKSGYFNSATIKSAKCGLSVFAIIRTGKPKYEGF